MRKNVKIISDDYYYIRGLQSLFNGKRYLNVTCYYLYDLTRGGLIDIFLTSARTMDDVVLLAVDDLNIIKEISCLDNTNVIYSIRTLSKNDMVLFYKDSLVIDRYISLDRLNRLFIKAPAILSRTEASLSKKEEMVIFNYFGLTFKRFSYLQKDIERKRVSYYKRSAYQKFRVSGDGAAYSIVKALCHIRPMVRQRVDL
ncbi:hypothetical protein HWQ17_05730 [Enterobacter pasteurii]|uniref:hypothetical protein n=1 Tax=Enterobacter pasteurii TaxID=3029761 RepID=UPI0011DDC79F|nr:hypothetical protein [Enterobacter pasteurii]QLA67175.1 hypothetical protein HWQ17_05730 [Enterobacter pasteurii]